MTDWVTVANVADVPDGGMVGATVGGVDVLVANLGGTFLSIGDECTHEGCALHDGDLDEEGVITCICHGSMFDVRTGEVVMGPAEDAEPVFRVRVEGDDIQVSEAEG